MIFGVGTDIIAVARIAEFHARHGERALEKVLAPSEREACRISSDPARFLAKRFAAKEALGKALGVGVRTPVLLSSIAVVHDDLGKPDFEFCEKLTAYINERHLVTHLSLSDERDYIVAFVVAERL